MMRFQEDFLAFEFGERWRVFKLDEHPDYRQRMEKVDGTKAVDFVGILDERELYLIEVKDFGMVQVRLTLLFDTIWQIYDKIPQNRGCKPILAEKILNHYVKCQANFLGF